MKWSMKDFVSCSQPRSKAHRCALTYLYDLCDSTKTTRIAGDGIAPSWVSTGRPCRRRGLVADEALSPMRPCRQGLGLRPIDAREEGMVRELGVHGVVYDFPSRSGPRYARPVDGLWWPTGSGPPGPEARLAAGPLGGSIGSERAGETSPRRPTSSLRARTTRGGMRPRVGDTFLQHRARWTLQTDRCLRHTTLTRKNRRRGACWKPFRAGMKRT